MHWLGDNTLHARKHAHQNQANMATTSFFEKSASEQLQALHEKTKAEKDNKPDTARITNDRHANIYVSPRATAVSEVAESSISVLPAAHVFRPPAQSQYVGIQAFEVVAILETAAREAQSLSEKIKLWNSTSKEWKRQV